MSGRIESIKLFLSGRRLGSVLAGFALLAVAVTGVLSFVSPYGERLAGLHTIAGFAFLGAVAIHVAHNAITWLRYLRARGRNRPSAALIVSLAIITVLLTGSSLRWRPFSTLLV